MKTGTPMNEGPPPKGFGLSRLLKEINLSPPGDPASEIIVSAPLERKSFGKLEDAEKFLKALAGDSLITFQTFDDVRDRKDSRLVKILHGTLKQHAPELTRLNK